MKNLLLSSPSNCLIILYIFIFISANTVTTQKFDSLLELPHSRPSVTRPGSRRVLSVGEFGAEGDGLTDDTQAFQNVWKFACLLPGRIRITIPNGYNLLLHPIDITGPCRSRITLQISGTIVAPKDPDTWAGLNPRKWLYFHEVNHLTVEGGGTINGNGQEWWARSCKVNATNPCRHAPTAITFHKCKDLRVENLEVVNSQQMHVAFTSCRRVKASKLKVLAPVFSPNTDGIHVSASRGVRVKDSIIGTGDDCISIVNNSSRIQITNIVCGPGHGISIGSLGKSNTWAQVHDVVVDNAFLSNTQNGVRIKTWQGGSGFATDMSFRNLLMENVSYPIIIDQYYCDSRLPCSNQTAAVKVKNISFENIKGTSATTEAIRFACSDDVPCEGLRLKDVELLSSFGGTTESFCWKAHGSSSGRVYPPSCFSCKESLIEQTITSISTLLSF